MKNKLIKIIVLLLAFVGIFCFLSVFGDFDTIFNSNIPKSNFSHQQKVRDFINPYKNLSIEEQIEAGRKIWEDKNGKISDWKIIVGKKRIGEFGRNICQTKTIELQKLYSPEILFNTLWHEMFHVSQCKKLYLWNVITQKEGEAVYKTYNMWKDLLNIEDWKEMAAQNETQGYLNAAIKYEKGIK